MLLLIGLAASYVGIESTGPAAPGADAAVMEIRPHAEGSPAALVEAHDCWTSRGPVGVIPGHVVVTRGGVAVYGGVRLTGLALEQAFDGIDHGLTVHGFCR